MPDLVLDYHRRRTPIDHPDLSITRVKLEYPTVDVSMLYLYMIGKAFVDVASGDRFTFVITVDSFANKQICGPQLMKAAESRYYEGFFGRCGADPRANSYVTWIDTNMTTADVILAKIVAGTVTNLGTQAVDLLDDVAYIFGLSCNATTIRSIRYNRWSISAGTISFGTPSVAISATDTSFASGKFAARTSDVGGPGAIADGLLAFLRAPSSPSPEVVAYFEVPIVGSGTPEDPFRPQMPQEIADHQIFGKVNRLALTWSALIPTDRATGRPIHETAIVMIFDQPDQQAHLHPIPKCLDALRAMPRVRVLRAEEARALALKMDDKLHPFDLMSVPRPTRAQVREYVMWCRSTFNVEVSEEDAARYISEDKGWG